MISSFEITTIKQVKLCRNMLTMKHKLSSKTTKTSEIYNISKPKYLASLFLIETLSMMAKNLP